MARRGPSHPGWENPPRLESFPRLRSREDRRANQPLFFVAVGVALVFVALVLFPIVTSSKGGPGASGLLRPVASGSAHPQGSGASARTSSAPRTSFFQYTVQKGDQLWMIAAKFNITLWELELANPQLANPDRLLAGVDVLNIPPPGLLTKPPESPSPQ
jgi:LysM repeat protein